MNEGLSYADAQHMVSHGAKRSSWIQLLQQISVLHHTSEFHQNSPNQEAT